MNKPNKDLIIIGAGAAGLSAAQYAARANLNVLVLEELAAGGQAMIIDKLENYPGFSEPVSGYIFAQKMEELTGPLEQEVYDAVMTVGEETGIEVIIDSQAVLYGGMDLTPAVINNLGG